MRLRRHAPAARQPAGRQRPLPQARPALSFRYRDRRSEDATGNLGRQPQQSSRGLNPAAARRAGHFLLRRFGALVLLAALVVSAVNLLSLSSQPRVLPLTTGAKNSFLHDPSVYQAAASQLLGNAAGNRNKITVNTAQLDQQLQRQFPELSSVSTTIPLFSKRPIIYVQTAPPALILATSQGSYVLDQTGKALLSADRAPAAIRAALPTVTDSSGLPISLNHQALTAADVNFIQIVVAQLAATQLSAAALDLPAATSELDVHLAGQPYLVKFNLQSADAREQSGTFLATKAQLDRQHVTPAHYVDVRLAGRAYYQ